MLNRRTKDEIEKAQVKQNTLQIIDNLKSIKALLSQQTNIDFSEVVTAIEEVHNSINDLDLRDRNLFIEQKNLINKLGKEYEQIVNRLITKIEAVRTNKPQINIDLKPLENTIKQIPEYLKLLNQETPEPINLKPIEKKLDEIIKLIKEANKSNKGGAPVYIGGGGSSNTLSKKAQENLEKLSFNEDNLKTTASLEGAVTIDKVSLQDTENNRINPATREKQDELLEAIELSIHKRVEQADDNVTTINYTDATKTDVATIVQSSATVGYTVTETFDNSGATTLVITRSVV
jgi:hypothetical protein